MNNNNFKSLTITNDWNQHIKFRALNKDQNFLFIKVNNSIRIYDLVLLKPIFNLHIEDNIVSFDISPKLSSMVINTEKKLIRYDLIFNNEASKQDFVLKMNFQVVKEVVNENVINLSISSLGDLIATLDKFGNVKLFNFNLEPIRTIGVSSELSRNILSYNFFQISYDTRNIVLSSFGNNKNSIFILYRNVFYNPKEMYPSTTHNEDKAYLESNCSNILNDEGLSYMKEVQKSINSYIKSVHSSIFLILTKNDSFIIARKILKSNERPELIKAYYLKINQVSFSRLYSSHMNHLSSSSSSRIVNNSLTSDCTPSFSLLYNNENPIFSEKIRGSIIDILPSYLINPDYWSSLNPDRNLEYDEESMCLQSSSLQNSSIEYILFNLKGKLQIFSIEGLNKSAFEEITVHSYKGFATDKNFSILRFCKTIDNKHSAFFLDENNLIRKFDIQTKFIEEEVALKLFTNIKSVEFNRKNRKLLILEYNDKNSIIIITNQKLYLTKVIVLENCIIKDLRWIDENRQNSHLNWGFASFISFTINDKLVIFNFRYPTLNHRINNITLDDLQLHHFIINTSNQNNDLSRENSNSSKPILNHINLSKNSSKQEDLSYQYYIELVVSHSSNNNDIDDETDILNLNIYFCNGYEINVSKVILVAINKSTKKIYDMGKQSEINKLITSAVSQEDSDTKLNNMINEELEEIELGYNSEFVIKKIKNYIYNYSLISKTTRLINFNNIAIYKEKLYYYDIDDKLSFVSVKKLSPIYPESYFNQDIDKCTSSDENQNLFDFVIQGKVLYDKFIDNDTLVIITDLFIESYTLSTKFYNRFKNQFLIKSPSQYPTTLNRLIVSSNDETEKTIINNRKLGNFIFLNSITKEGIKFERLPKNKSLFENFEIEFNLPQKIGNVTQFISNCGILVLNEQQIEFIEDIGKLKTSQEIRLDTTNSFFNKLQNLYLLNINPNSLFELETMLDYYLDNKEEIVKYILRIFFNLQNKLLEGKFDISLISTKGLPNFFNLGFNDIKNLILDNNQILIKNDEKSFAFQNKMSTSSLNHINPDESFKLDDVDFNRNIEEEMYINNMDVDFRRQAESIYPNERFLENNKTKIFKMEKEKILNKRISIISQIQRPFELFTQNTDMSLQEQVSLFYRIERNISYLENVEKRLAEKLKNQNEYDDNNIYNEDNEESYNDTNNTSRVTNLRHLIHFYETVISESTCKLDHITKYFVVKIKSKSLALDYSSFRLNSSDLCWLSLINDQEFILKFFIGDRKQVNFKVLQRFCIPLWIKNEYKLKELLELSGKNEYNQLIVSDFGTNDTNKRNLAEVVALFFYLSGKPHLVLEKFDKESHNSAVAKFLRMNFTEENTQKQARNNAYHLLTKKRYLIAIYMFLLGNDIRSAIEVSLDNLKDINLAYCILRLYPTVCAYHDKIALGEQKERLFSKIFYKFGQIVRDPWLILFSLCTQEKYDQAINYIQKYKDYNIKNETNETTLKEELEFISNDYEILNNVMDMQIFDYKLFFYLKEIEKLYNTSLANQKKSQQSQSNTNFGDVWGSDDDDSPSTNVVVTPAVNLLQEIKPNYINILEYCYEDLIYKGVLISPIISHYKNISNEYFPEGLKHNFSLIKSFTDLVCKRAVLDTVNLQSMNDNKPLDEYLVTFNKLLQYFQKNGLLKLEDAYFNMNLSYLKLDKYNFSIYSSYKSKNVLSSLKIVGNEFENGLIVILSEMFSFNSCESINLKSINCFIKNKVYQIAYFLQEILIIKKSTNSTGIDYLENNRSEAILIIRIIIKCYTFLYGAAKACHRYNKVREIYQQFEFLIDEYRSLVENPEALKVPLDKIILFCKSLTQKIKEIKPIQNTTTLIFIMILNNNVIYKFKNLLENKSIEVFKPYSKATKGHINEFKFLKRLLLITQNYLQAFNLEFERILKKHIEMKEKASILKELKEVYETDVEFSPMSYTKFNIIDIKQFFKNSEKFAEFETEFTIQDTIYKYLSIIPTKLYYEKRNYIEKYNDLSVEVVSDLFGKSGYELLKLNEDTIIHNFDFNSCNNSNMIISLANHGHMRVNLLPSILKANRSQDFLKLLEPDQYVDEKDYTTYYEMQDLDLIFNNKTHYGYKDILPVLKNIFCMYKPASYYKNNALFHNKSIIPPDLYNGDHYSNYLLEKQSKNKPVIQTYSSCLVSHPLLPLYCSATDKGLIGVWSYAPNQDKSLFEFYNNKQAKDQFVKTKLFKKIKFNSYGNEFLTIDEEKALNCFDFDSLREYPKYNISSSSIGKDVRDAEFIGCSGLLASTYIEDLNGSVYSNNFKNTLFWDFLLPKDQAIVGQVNGCGGSLINLFGNEPSVVVANNSIGHLSFIDRRKNQVVNSIEAHTSEIKSVVISNTYQFMCTSSKDGTVKIWDISNRTDPYVIETIVPFVKPLNAKKTSLLLKNGNLYAKGSCSIKLLRNKLE